MLLRHITSLQFLHWKQCRASLKKSGNHDGPRQSGKIRPMDGQYTGEFASEKCFADNPDCLKDQVE